MGRVLAEDVKLASLIFLCFLCLLLDFNHFSLLFHMHFEETVLNQTLSLAFTFCIFTACFKSSFIYYLISSWWHTLNFVSSVSFSPWWLLVHSVWITPLLPCSVHCVPLYLSIAFWLSGQFSVWPKELYLVPQAGRALVLHVVDLPCWHLNLGRMIPTDSLLMLENWRQEPFLHWFFMGIKSYAMAA